ncbi:FAD-dependent oxidoreductase [Geosporobacter ferrireducens]|uniref:FAD-dependent oxidoreductase n=1 Tax=Geosporobacter ferrireducens TaxID=1424294 RepID=A0A1D8GIV1_9FIRM|nr:FAD-dependent oxidoreductase [Geosporobacter ferrireducens]AOT70772.1 FAD-dependent oxidoreductase [Geosporobacter ferrireducens]MTI57262.1 FAD-dependent oxidoreductase [Geosporobacter ferrireducens]
MTKIVVIGGGWAGCAAAVSAAKAGAQVTLLERTDMLLGTGLVGGIMRNNGRFTATEELIAMGGGDLFQICDQHSRHKNISFPGHDHVNLYDIADTHGAVLGHLQHLDVHIVFESRVNKAVMQEKQITAVEDQSGRVFHGDTFIDTTGTAGPMHNCVKYGNGCAMCILRCPSFGGRVSIANLAGIEEMVGKKADGSIGAMSGACKLYKESLSQEIQDALSTKGVAIIPLSQELIEDHLGVKACQQYALQEFKDNIILLDTGHAKLMAPYFSLERLRKIPGFEYARYEDPYAGGKGNSMRYFSMAPRDNHLKVEGVDNLFCAGEKAGLLVGHTEAIITGTLAGHNSVRQALNKPLLQLSKETAIGDAIAFVKEMMTTEAGMGKKYTFSGSIYFERMKEKGLYRKEQKQISKDIEALGYTGIFAQKLIKDMDSEIIKSKICS